MSLARRLKIFSPLSMLTAITGIFLTLWVAGLQQQLNKSSLRSVFEKQSSDFANDFQKTLDQKIEVLQSLQAFFLSSDSVTQAEFHSFTRGALARHPDIIALNWIPRITHQQRAEFESRLQSDHPDGGGIYETSSAAKQRHPAPQRAVYFPVEYSEPSHNNQPTFGLNVLSRPQLGQAIRQIYSDSGLLSTSPFKLVQRPEGPPGIVIFAPVFNRRMSGDRKPFPDDLDGLLVLVLQPGLTLQSTIEHNIDQTAYLLHSGLSEQSTRLSFDNQEYSQPLEKDDLIHNFQIKIPGGQWYLEIHRHTDTRLPLSTYSTLILGLLITALLVLSIVRDKRRNLSRLLIAQQLAHSRQRAQAAIEIAQVGICEIDCDSRSGILNQQGMRLLCWSAVDDRITLDQLLSLMDPTSRQQFEQQLRLLQGHKKQNFKLDIALFDSSSACPARWFRFLCKLRCHEGHSTLIATFIDIDEQKQAEARLTQLANHDALTGLPNRRLLNDRLQMAIANAHRHQAQVAVALLDLNGFKPVNDNLGHDSGDLLLVQLAQRLSALTRENDTCARIGGDEFLLVLSDQANPEETLQSLQRIHQTLELPFELNGHRTSISASIGVASYPVDGDNLTQLIRRADQAMYVAKALHKDQGRGQTASFGQINS